MVNADLVSPFWQDNIHPPMHPATHTHTHSPTRTHSLTHSHTLLQNDNLTLSHMHRFAQKMHLFLPTLCFEEISTKGSAIVAQKVYMSIYIYIDTGYFELEEFGNVSSASSQQDFRLPNAKVPIRKGTTSMD